MPEYLKALHERFTRKPPEAERTEKELNRILARLCSQLGRSQRILLRHLLDLEDDLRNKISLHSFITGIRVAGGLYRELTEELPYSFYQEEENRARQFIINEEGSE